MRALSKTLAVAALAAIGSFAVEHAIAVPSTGTARPGQPAPSFSAPDIAGKTVRLGDYAAKIVVLEWTNDGCPFVGKHYNSGNMQALQQKYTGTGVVWLTIASSAPGEQGYVTPAEAKADLARWRATPTDFLLD
ncbi:MAG: redoxin domain-containing protein, partial [Alphaproteobacteria bacterium]|nr:redoxin domain-containing protein [Alphaproteobacteria bacterium]